MVECQIQCSIRLDFTLTPHSTTYNVLCYGHYPRSGNSYIVTNAAGGPTNLPPPTATDVLRVCFPYGVGRSIGLVGGGRETNKNGKKVEGQGYHHVDCTMGSVSSPAAITGVYTPEDGKRRYIIGALGGFPPEFPDAKSSSGLGESDRGQVIESHGSIKDVKQKETEKPVEEDSFAYFPGIEEQSMKKDKQSTRSRKACSFDVDFDRPQTKDDQSILAKKEQLLSSPRPSKSILKSISKFEYILQNDASSKKEEKIKPKSTSSVPLSGKYTLLAVICDQPLLRTGTKTVIHHFLKRSSFIKATSEPGNEPYFLHSEFSQASTTWTEQQVTLLVSSIGTRKFWADVAFDPLFVCFGADKIRELLGLMLCGEKIVLLTKHKTSWLPILWEALLALLGPFEWPFIYSPMFPHDAMPLLDAPHPFLLGIYAENVTDMVSEIKRNYPIDVHCYNVDSGKKVYGTSVGVHTVPRIFIRQPEKVWKKKSRVGCFKECLVRVTGVRGCRGRCFRCCESRSTISGRDREAKDVRIELLESTALGYQTVFRWLQSQSGSPWQRFCASLEHFCRFSRAERKFLSVFTSEKNLIWRRFVEGLDSRVCMFLEVTRGQSVALPVSYFVDESGW